jgi:ABC-2 type transport system permease protein
VFRIAQFLPFFYQMYFPAAIFTGRIELPLALQGLVIQVGWVIVLLIINQLLWTRGLRRHTAVGG